MINIIESCRKMVLLRQEDKQWLKANTFTKLRLQVSNINADLMIILGLICLHDCINPSYST